MEISIEGVKTKELKEFTNDQGSVQHMLRSDDSHYTSFGEIYFSTVNPGITKGWHKQKTHQNILSCIEGNVTFVLYDSREHSKTKGALFEIEIGDNKRTLLIIPPGITYAWKNSSEKKAIIANVTDKPYDPEDGIKIPLSSSEVPYDWQ